MAMTMKETTVAGGKTFLRSADFRGRPYMLTSESVTADETTGKKIVKAGTPLPTNDADALGLLFKDADVTDGDKAVSLVYEGDVSIAKLAANGITVDDTAKAVLPRITFFD